MEMKLKVPIRNLFCLLSYANNMPELIHSMSGVEEELITYDFLAKRFNREAKHLLSRGLVKGYVSRGEETNRLGGRMLMGDSMSYILEKKPLVVCEKDEYSRDILLNQIMKITLEGIYGNRLVKEETRKESYLLWEQLPDVSMIPFRKETFIRLRFNRLNFPYKSMIHIAQLLYELKLLSHKSGGWSLFNAKLDDAAMNRLFEEFLLRFYQIEQSQYRVQSERLQWKLEGDQALLPGMKTDVSMTNKDGQEKIIIDAKFYKSMFQQNFEKASYHSHNMYQMFTYLMHQPQDMKLRGILIYPYNSYLVNETYQWDENITMEIVSINLNDSWSEIYHTLKRLIGRE
ncbi:McrC family protein [Halobacillus sp. H74]|uniref:McrC family protein n=1 Tax=Halobacillus sp. H74 TaxID=3457436 RepID=UPI003FCD1274